MKISKIILDNFRSKEHLELDLGAQLTILVGENGSGKTTILDALALGLGAFITHLPKASGLNPKNTDIRQFNNKKASYLRIRMDSTNGISWARTVKRDKSTKTKDLIPAAIGLAQLKRYIDQQIINPFNENTAFSLPVFCYYGVTRALLEVPLRRRGFPKSHQRFEALDSALNASTRFKSAFVWFYNKEFEEQKRQKELKSFEFKLPELEAVRNAIKSLFPDVDDPHIMLNPLRFAVKLNNEILDITQLSDGYKTLLSLVIDLSSRMALANPHLTNPLHSEAIVMIDEIDLHLHPEWQKRIIDDLLKVFINTQFILTTHSPYIIESINNHLMRYQIKDNTIQDETLQHIYPLSPSALEAYYLTYDEITPMLDRELNLIDDKLIHPYNSIAAMFEKMRDIQWEQENDD
jgi:predicted ATP-binding protein involved in virulence